MERASSSSHGTPTIGACTGFVTDGVGEATRLTDGELEDETPYSITPDGKRLAFTARGNGKSPDLFTAPIEGDSAHLKLGKPELFVGTPFFELSPAFSPDGRWMAYMSQESGIAEVLCAAVSRAWSPIADFDGRRQFPSVVSERARALFHGAGPAVNGGELQRQGRFFRRPKA